MLISEIISLLHADILTAPDYFDTDIQNAFCSDMMSDVLAYANDHTMLITGLTNPQAIRTAENARHQLHLIHSRKTAGLQYDHDGTYERNYDSVHPTDNVSYLRDFIRSRIARRND